MALRITKFGVTRLDAIHLCDVIHGMIHFLLTLRETIDGDCHRLNKLHWE